MDVSFLVVFVILAIAAIVVGIHLRQVPEQPREFFRRRAPSVFGPKISEHIYTTDGMRVAGLAWIIGGSIFVAVGLFLIIGLLVRG